MTRKKAIITWASRVLMLLAIGFMVFGLFQYEFDFSMLSSPFVVIGLLLLAFVLGLGVFFFSFNFHWLTQKLSGVAIDRNLIIKVYCATNMYKYLPINIMQYVGRGQIALETKGVKQTHIALATLLENIFRGLAAVLIAAFLGVNIIYYVQLTLPAWSIWVGAVVSVSVIIAVMIFFRRRITVPSMVILLGNSALRAISISATFVLTLMLLGQDFTFSLVIQIASLYALAWLVGILIPIAPGGIGIRETAIFILVGGLIYEPVLAAGIVVHRILYTIGDVLAWLLSMYYKNKTTQRCNNMEMP